VPDPALLRHALVLSAGLGTRLRPLTLVRAKPAIPVAGDPIVRRITRWLAEGGVEDVVLNLHHLPETLTAVMGDGSDLGVRVRYSWEQPEVLGSAGGPRQALDIIGADTFLIVNGDTLTDVDLARLADAHAAVSPPNGDALVTLALVRNQEPLRYGGILLEGSHVTGFARRGPGAVGSFHFVGVQAVNAAAFRWLRPGEPVNSIGQAYDQLIGAYPGCIRGFVSRAGFWDIGTVADYVSTSRALAATPSNRQPSRVHIDPTARVSDTILWDDIEIGANCAIEGCIVTDRVTISAGSTYRDSILMSTADGISAVPLL
jgi:NDP-sugar pyrophosphorylase family protein